MNKWYNCWSPEWMRKRASLGCPPWIPDTKYNSLRSWSTLVQIQTAETTPFTCELGSLLGDKWQLSLLAKVNTLLSDLVLLFLFVLNQIKSRDNFYKIAPSWFQVKETSSCNKTDLLLFCFWKTDPQNLPTRMPIWVSGATYNWMFLSQPKIDVKASPSHKSSSQQSAMWYSLYMYIFWVVLSKRSWNF